TTEQVDGHEAVTFRAHPPDALPVGAAVLDPVACVHVPTVERERGCRGCVTREPAERCSSGGAARGSHAAATTASAAAAGRAAAAGPAARRRSRRGAPRARARRDAGKGGQVSGERQDREGAGAALDPVRRAVTVVARELGLPLPLEAE